MSKKDESKSPEDTPGYATAYRSYEKEIYTVGLGSIFANETRSKSKLVAGEMVRVQCEMTGSELKGHEDGTIVVNHKIPSKENATVRDRISNMAGKILVGLIGEEHTTTFRPVPDGQLSIQALAKLQAENELFSNLQVVR